MFRLALFSVLAGSTLRALAQGPAAGAQIDQARQFSSPVAPLDLPTPLLGETQIPEATAAPDDAFGAQVIFKRVVRPTPFTAFAEVSAFFTNNVALARRDTLDDKFLVIAAGAGYSRPVGFDLRFEMSVRASLYRYAEYRELDFQSVDVSAGVVWSPPALHGTEVALRYLFTDLTAAESQDEIYRNHAVLLGVQKVIPFSAAHAAYFGASGQWSWSDPAEPGRDEYVAFAGYHMDATRHIGADLSYRYGYFVYREADGRQDQNHTFSLTLRYAPVEWFAISANSFLGINRSNRSAFDYELWNAGVGLQFSLKF